MGITICLFVMSWTLFVGEFIIVLGFLVYELLPGSFCVVIDYAVVCCKNFTGVIELVFCYWFIVSYVCFVFERYLLVV